MTNSVSAAFKRTASEQRHQRGEQAARTAISDWKGSSWTDACAAALKLGHLERLLGYDRAIHLLRQNFEIRKVDPSRWRDVKDAFIHGKSTVNLNDVWSSYPS